MRKRMLRNTASIAAAIISYVTTYVIAGNHYYSILSSNVFFLGFLQIFDFDSALQVDELKKKYDTSVDTEVNLVLPADAKSRMNNDQTIQLKSKPKHYLEFNSFYSAFKLRYILEDSNSFIAKFSSTIKMNFFVSFALFLLIAVIFTNMPALEVPAGMESSPHAKEHETFQEVLKLGVAFATILIQLSILLRPFFVYYERNSSLVKS
jgi:hypothetical protein